MLSVSSKKTTLLVVCPRRQLPCFQSISSDITQNLSAHISLTIWPYASSRTWRKAVLPNAWEKKQTGLVDSSGGYHSFLSRSKNICSLSLLPTEHSPPNNQLSNRIHHIFSPWKAESVMVWQFLIGGAVCFLYQVQMFCVWLRDLWTNKTVTALLLSPTLYPAQLIPETRRDFKTVNTSIYTAKDWGVTESLLEWFWNLLGQTLQKSPGVEVENLSWLTVDGGCIS